MITRLSHITLFVNNQDEALSFYRDKLGFKLHTDAMVGADFRWLTITAPEQPDFEIILMEPKPGMLMDEATAAQLRAIMEKGVLGAGAFHTDDCRGTYEPVFALGHPSRRSASPGRPPGGGTPACRACPGTRP